MRGTGVKGAFARKRSQALLDGNVPRVGDPLMRIGIPGHCGLLPDFAEGLVNRGREVGEFTWR
jgi:hypothetical protein